MRRARRRRRGSCGRPRAGRRRRLRLRGRAAGPSRRSGPARTPARRPCSPSCSRSPCRSRARPCAADRPIAPTARRRCPGSSELPPWSRLRRRSAAAFGNLNAAGDNRRMDAAAAHARYEAAFEGRDAPFAFVDLDAMWSNADEMLARAGGKPIRVASKSVRCRALLEAIAARDERFCGLMTFTLRESLWLGERGALDMLLAYPTTDVEALGRLGEGGPVLMVDSVEHLDLIGRATKVPVRLCIEVDLSYP